MYNPSTKIRVRELPYLRRYVTLGNTALSPETICATTQYNSYDEKQVGIDAKPRRKVFYDDPGIIIYGKS